MPRGNAENLVPNTSRTPEERRTNAQRAGIASGKSRRDKKFLQEALRKALAGKYNIDDKELGGYDALAIRIIQQALDGNVQAFKEIRDTIGEKPKEQLELDNNELSGIRIHFVDKSQRKDKQEQDPKIIGDYTPPSNIEE